MTVSPTARHVQPDAPLGSLTGAEEPAEGRGRGGAGWPRSRAQWKGGSWAASSQTGTDVTESQLSDAIEMMEQWQSGQAQRNVKWASGLHPHAAPPHLVTPPAQCPHHLAAGAEIAGRRRRRRRRRCRARRGA